MGRAAIVATFHLAVFSTNVTIFTKLTPITSDKYPDHLSLVPEIIYIVLRSLHVIQRSPWIQVAR